jgi:hypothetical protein
MDRLFERYADPFSFINGMILAGRFDEFVSSFTRTVYEEKEEETQWQFFLHKVLEGSFEDFKKGLKVQTDNQNMSAWTFETTIKQSMNILQKLSPEKGGEA